MMSLLVPEIIIRLVFTNVDTDIILMFNALQLCTCLAF